jgi:hypothetical protein
VNFAILAKKFGEGFLTPRCEGGDTMYGVYFLRHRKWLKPSDFTLALLKDVTEKFKSDGAVYYHYHPWHEPKQGEILLLFRERNEGTDENVQIARNEIGPFDLIYRFREVTQDSEYTLQPDDFIVYLKDRDVFLYFKRERITPKPRRGYVSVLWNGL